MDPRRFDSLTRRLGTRLSRRDALRAGAGATLGAFAIATGAPSFAQDEEVPETAVEEIPETTVKDRFISVRTYPYTGPIDAAEAGLKGVIPVMYEQPGFISIHFIAGDQEIHAVMAFLDLDTAISGADALDAWIAEHAQAILSGAPQIRSGPVFLRSELHTGCPCTTDAEDSCNSDRLACCGTSDVEGGPGVCLTVATTCPGEEDESDETEEPMVIPTATAGGTSTADADCTSEGCACIAGTDGACSAGLQCCGTGELGGAGACFGNCGGGGCTSDGCACVSGVPGACDEGLECCGAEPGAEGICQLSCDAVGLCPGGEGCDCISGVDGTCDEGLVCCETGEPGGSGTCQGACA